MSVTRHLACALITALALFSAAGAHAKGPQGVGDGSGTMPTHSASPNSNGVGSNTWTQPPGWGNATESKGWGGATTPPGWDNNTTGQANGWNGGTTPPGFDKR
jgi:hypothetical protein